MKPAIVSTLAAMLLVQPATAQETGTRIGATAGRKDGELLMQQMAECVADRQRGTVRALLATAPGSEQVTRLHKKLTVEYEHCMVANDRLVVDAMQIAMKPASLRRALAANMFMQDIKVMPEAPVGDEAYRWFGGTVTEDAYAKDASLSAFQLARCTLRKDWKGSRALLLAQPGTPDEVKAMRALAPTVAPCVPHDLSITLKPTVMRSLLAEAAYYTLTAVKAGKAPRS